MKRNVACLLGLISCLSLILAACGDSTSAIPATTTLAATTAATVQPATTGVAPATVSTTINPATTSPAQTSATTPGATTAASATTAPGATTQAGSTPPPNGDWTTYHHDNARTGYVPGEKDPTAMAKKWSVPVDGAVYAEPLVVGSHVLVATEANTIYSLNATNGQVEWKTNVGAPVPRSALPCGNIDPSGITGTPVYDPATKLIFAVANTTGPAHILVGVDLQSGQVKIRRPVDLPGMEPAPHQERAALALNNGMVYIAFGGLFGDCGNYKGTVIASRTDGTGDLLSFQVPTTREGGIWAASGPAIDSNGKIYVAVGNGEQTSGEWDKSDSVLRLSPDLKLEDGFAPKEWASENSADKDLGSMGPALLGNGLIFIAGKGSTGYSLKSGALGGVGGQLQQMEICSGFGGAAVVDSRVFVPCTSGLQEITIAADGKMTPGWKAPADVNGSPIAGGKTVYILSRSGTLYALDSDTGKQRATVKLPAVNRFATPTLSNGNIFVGTLTSVEAVSLQ
jgi:outer membrane protein assembly factor BamB